MKGHLVGVGLSSCIIIFFELNISDHIENKGQRLSRWPIASPTFMFAGLKKRNQSKKEEKKKRTVNKIKKQCYEFKDTICKGKTSFTVFFIPKST